MPMNSFSFFCFPFFLDSSVTPTLTQYDFDILQSPVNSHQLCFDSFLRTDRDFLCISITFIKLIFVVIFILLILCWFFINFHYREWLLLSLLTKSGIVSCLEPIALYSQIMVANEVFLHLKCFPLLYLEMLSLESLPKICIVVVSNRIPVI